MMILVTTLTLTTKSKMRDNLHLRLLTWLVELTRLDKTIMISYTNLNKILVHSQIRILTQMKTVICHNSQEISSYKLMEIKGALLICSKMEIINRKRKAVG